MQTKKVYKYFSIFEYEKEQNYLTQMHKSGWKFVKVTGFCMYHFEKCTPEDVIYQLDYNQDGIANKDEYVKMFTDCGWEYLQDYVGYSYFRKSATQNESADEIFCDDASKLQMLDRIFKGRVIPLLLIFAVVLVPNFILNLYHKRFPVAVLFGLAIILYIFVFTILTYQYFKYIKNKK